MTNRKIIGYIPGAEALSAVERLASKLKHAKPSLIYLLDRTFHVSRRRLALTSGAWITAVMGDAGRLYVAADVIPVYREMLPLATIITPNWFEVE
jgi:pyridoxine kinase